MSSLSNTKLSDAPLDPPEEEYTINDAWHDMAYIADLIMTYTKMSLNECRMKCVEGELEKLNEIFNKIKEAM